MKTLHSTVHSDIDPFDDTDLDDYVRSCACEDAIIKGYKFHHYEEGKDRLMSSFDDFGYLIYTDGNKELKFLAHHYLGIVDSGIHAIQKIPSNLKLVRFEKDNNVIPLIYDLLTDVDCKYCKEHGHKIDYCPRVPCKRCHVRGHLARNCENVKCTHCKRWGHSVDNCGRLKCRYCKKPGHKISECKEIVCRHCDDNHFTNQCPYIVHKN